MKRLSVVLVSVALAFAARELPAQSHGFGICKPRSERAGKKTGCFIMTEQEQGPLVNSPVFWHVTSFETPHGTQTGRPDGPPVIVAGGQPMELTATGTTMRKSIVLILHESGKTPASMDSTWTPRRLCAR